MTVATSTKIRNPSPRGLVVRQALPSISFYGGYLVGRRRGSALCQIPLSTAPYADLIIEGVVEYIESPPFTSSSTTDAGGGAVDAITLQPQNIRIVTAPTGWFDTAPSGANQIKAQHVGLSAYAFDNNTVYLTDSNGQLPRAGTIDRVSPDGKVSLVFDNKVAEGAGGEFDDEPTVRCVMTALAAYTAASGTITVTGTTALGTQDGVTVAPGDLVWLPEYTNTANGSVNVSNANSGPYEIIALGGSGAHPVLSRPAWWAHGAVMPLGASIKVAEGTLFGQTVWDVGATAGSIIGTDDPACYPRRVIQKVQLSASTVTITNVPIRNADRCDVNASLNTANGTLTSTVRYGMIAAPTAGPIGTASLVVDAIASGQGKNGTADTSYLNVTIGS